MSNPLLYPADAQQLPPVALCDCCGGELYPEDFLYAMDGEIVCEDCFFDYVARRFASLRITAQALCQSNSES